MCCIVDFLLDDGIKFLFKGCMCFIKFVVYFCYGGFMDKGMGYIGEYGYYLKWLLFGCIGEFDIGLVNMVYKV